MLFGLWTRVGPVKHVLDGGEHRRHRTNTTEPARLTQHALLRYAL